MVESNDNQMLSPKTLSVLIVLLLGLIITLVVVIYEAENHDIYFVDSTSATMTFDEQLAEQPVAEYIKPVEISTNDDEQGLITTPKVKSNDDEQSLITTPKVESNDDEQSLITTPKVEDDITATNIASDEQEGLTALHILTFDDTTIKSMDLQDGDVITIGANNYRLILHTDVSSLPAKPVVIGESELDLQLLPAADQASDYVLLLNDDLVTKLANFNTVAE
jgi:hypothetical protein